MMLDLHARTASEIQLCLCEDGGAQLGQLIAGQDGGAGQRRCRRSAFAWLGQLDSFLAGSSIKWHMSATSGRAGVWGKLPESGHITLI